MFKRTKITLGLGLIAMFSIFALSACMPIGGSTGEGGEATGGGLGAFIPLILLVVVFYFILIRPQNKKNKQVNEMRSALKRGDWITTIGGFRGRVVKVKEDVLTIEVGADKVKLEVMRWGISKIEESAPERKTTKKVREEEPVEEEEEQPKRKPRKLTATPKKETEPEDEDEELDEDDDEDEDDDK